MLERLRKALVGRTLECRANRFGTSYRLPITDVEYTVHNAMHLCIRCGDDCGKGAVEIVPLEKAEDLAMNGYMVWHRNGNALRFWLL